MSGGKAQIKLAIVDDHNLFRKGLQRLISLGDKEKKYVVMFEAEDGLDLKDKLNPKSLPDIIMLDIDMPGMDGFETAAWLRKVYPDIGILIISMIKSEEAIVRMIRLGVSGYLSKDIEVEDLHSALSTIADKKIYYPDMVASAMANALQNNDRTHAHAEANVLWGNLTENERTFLKYACSELTYSEIAEKMKLSPKTIDGYREALFARFQVKSRVSLALFAVKHQLVKL
jgi:DNA-binding NarL/FixJ family response regulator